MEKSNHIDTSQPLDLIIIGGGINGAGIAADASGRGLRVGLYEADDFASATSSASSKLIHGGLRYLEHYEFRLVSEALAEREVLLKKAPHITYPIRFCLPHRPHLRPAWMIRAGLFLYDHLGKRSILPASKSVEFDVDSLLLPEITNGFEYSDCWVDDARLVILNIMDAAERGAEIRNRCKVEKAVREGELWRVTISDRISGETFERTARGLVNAAGPWVKDFYDEGLELTSPRNIRLIKGSHIVVDRLDKETKAYILQNEDGRIVFVIPYLDRFSMIGTTDIEYHGDPREVAIDDDETDYLLDIYNRHFRRQCSREDIVWDWSGVRSLCDDESQSPQAVTRDYTLELQQDGSQPPLLSVFGGKLTTYRKLAESVLDKLAPYYPLMGDNWTRNSFLPGGNADFDSKQLAQALAQQFSWLPLDICLRLAQSYGDRVNVLMADVKIQADMGRYFGEGVYQLELDYMIAHEFVQTAEDALWRRSKLGLYLTAEQQQAVDEYIHSCQT